jgi:RNA-directed DNA polymerase
MTTTPEPKDKLDTMSEMAFAAGMAALGVNGPEDQPRNRDVNEWETIDWRSCEEQVRRLRQRIFTGLA